MSKSRIHKQTIFMSLNSFCMSFSGAIILTLASATQGKAMFNIGLGNFVILRAISEAIGYIAKSMSGYWSDRLSNRRLFLLAGYIPVPIIKLVLLIFSCRGGLSTLKVRYAVFTIANVLDRLFNVFRDNPRDSLICDHVNSSHLISNLVFRKMLSAAGTFFGLLFFSWALNRNVALSYLLAISTIMSFIGLGILFIFIEDKKLVNRQNLPEKKINILSILWTKFMKNKASILLLVVAIILFVGKIDDMLLMTFFKDSSLVKTSMNIGFHISGVLISIFVIIASIRGSLLQIVVGLAFTIVNGIFYLFIGNKSIYYAIFSVFVVCVHGMYRSSIDSVLISGLLSNLNKDKSSVNTNGTAIGILNFCISLGIIIRSVLSLWIPNDARIILSCVISLIGIILYIPLCYFK